ncbi:hypothetical protein EYZ11_007616 [Aspergillus tanneri]|uniref:N-terminal Ras-GEF domain-containing protein n=1 Tax=Aspergillus tanneri TaxID=1220188 RepID=A0A4S3JCT8_9EURO|nr:hypothetical protein EYZ11_007616 [Aspergillus tanneri]
MEEPPTCPSEDRTSQISLLTSDDAPWYVSLDHEDEIEYDIAENQHTLKCGTLVGLVEQLTRHDRLDASFNETFLTTFQTFVSASELFEMLIKRFNIEPPAELDESEHERWKKQKQQTIRLRVVNILKNWFERFWMEPNDEETRNFLQNAHDLISDSPTIMAMPSSLQLLAIVEQRLQGHGSIKRLVRTPTASAPLPIIPRSMKKLKLLDIDPVECARQLTIVESGLYRRIRPAECLNKRWKKKSPENPEPVTGVNATILHSNKLANWVGETILNQTTVKKRVTMIKYFVSVADVLSHFPFITF